MQKIAIRTAAVVLGAALSVAGAASVAEADTKSIKDPKPNITKVTVKHGSKNIKVTTRTGVIRPGTYLTVYLDTDPDQPGPWSTATTWCRPASSPRSMRISRSSVSRATRCPPTGCAVAATRTDERRSWSRCPRSCVGEGDKVRASVRGYFYVKGPNVVDCGYGLKKLGGWVRRWSSRRARPGHPRDGRAPGRPSASTDDA